MVDERKSNSSKQLQSELQLSTQILQLSVATSKVMKLSFILKLLISYETPQQPLDRTRTSNLWIS
jgi:hypothetical protein